MILDRLTRYGLLASLLLNAGLGVALYASHASTRMAEAKVKPLEAQVGQLKGELTNAERKAEGYRTALAKCEQEKLRVAQANADAAAQAAASAAASAAATEDYLQKLASHPSGCEAILKAQVCPALMDY